MFVLNIEMVFQNTHFSLKVSFASSISISSSIWMSKWVWLIGSITNVITATYSQCQSVSSSAWDFWKESFNSTFGGRLVLKEEQFPVMHSLLRIPSSHVNRSTKFWLIIWQPLTLGKDAVEISYKQFRVFTYFTCPRFMENDFVLIDLFLFFQERINLPGS